MKKRGIFYILMVAFLAIKVQAQDIPSKWSYGLYIQPGSANGFYEIASLKPVFGLEAGLMLGYMLSPKLGLQTGIGYSGKGFSYKTSQGYFQSVYYSHTYEGKLSRNYLDIPLTANYWIVKNEHFGLVGNAGVVVDFLISESSESKLVGSSHFSSESTGSSDSELDISYTFGLRSEFYLSEKIGAFIQPNYSQMVSRFRLSNYGARLGVVKHF
jgi:Outer membrane protein beta-barrel domain